MDNKIFTSNNLKTEPLEEWIIRYLLAITKGYGVRAATKSKVKKLLLKRCALRKFHVIDCHNTRDQVASDRRSKRE